ncbi:MarR family transcriptional regulator [Enterococcus sp. DIV1444a]|uniref:MarR family transcriptional regulator n=1 Tax=Enterococcus sp. DIV1444a TaxID=2774679 RepID=UPI00372A443C
MPIIEVTEYEQMMLLGWRGMAQTTKEEALKETEETYFAKSKQTFFTLQELADKWGCSKGHVHRILKKYNVEPIGKRGKENEYDGSQAEEVKAIHDGKVIYQDKLNWKMRAM